MFRSLTLGGVVLLVCVSLVHQAMAQTRPVTVDDVVGLESFGRASISPDGRWAIYEKQAAYDTAPVFDYGHRTGWAITTLWLVDLTESRPRPKQLLPQEGQGLLRAVWSPSGSRLVIWKFTGGHLEIGVVSVPDFSVTWTGLTPDIPLAGADTTWVSDNEVALLVRPDGSLPNLLRYFGGSQTRTADAWEETRLGRQASRTVVETRAGVANAEAPEASLALLLLNVAQQRTSLIARGAITDFAISPNGRRVAVVMGGEAIAVDGEAVLQAQVPRRQRLHLVDVHGRDQPRIVTRLDVAPHLLRWSPDSERLLVWMREDGRGWDAGGLFQVSALGVTRSYSMSGITVGSGAEVLRGVRADWVGHHPVIRARSVPGERFDWFALSDDAAPKKLTGALASPPTQISAVNGDTLLLMADNRFWAARADGLQSLPSGDGLRAWTDPDPNSVMRHKVNTAPQRDWAPALDERGAARVASITREPVSHEFSDGETPRLLAIAPQAALGLRRRGWSETLSLGRFGETIDLDEVNSGLADVVLAQPVPIHHRDVFGRPALSWLFLPAGGAAAARALIVEVYPGAVDAGGWYGPTRLAYGFRAAVAAGAGYAVLSPAIPVDRDDAVGAAYYARSVDLSVDATLAAFANLPADRMAILGHSFGGHAALAIAAETSRYRSYVISSAAVDQFGEWGEFVPATRVMPEDGLMMINQQGWVEVGQGAVGASPWDDPQAYIARSPYLTIDRISAPVLLLTADRDYVPMSQMERVFSGLFRLGGEARLVTYWGEHHHVQSPANIRDRYSEIFRWLDRTLGAPTDVTSSPADAPRP